MTAFGFYPPAHYTFLFKIKSYLLFVGFVLPVPVFGTLYFMLKDTSENDQDDENAFVVVQMSCQIIKLLSFIKCCQRVKKCITYFDSSFFSFINSEQKKVMSAYIWVCRRNSIIYLSGVVVAIVFWVSRPLMFSDRKTLVDIWLPFSHYNFVLFYLIYFFIAISKYVNFVITNI